MSSSSNASNCSRDAIPENLPIPANITYAVIPGQNASAPWMVNCCDPYPVYLVESCWLWCQISPGKGTRANVSSDNAIMNDFSSCLRANGRDLNVSASILFHSRAPQDQRASLLRVVLVTLATSMVMTAFSAM